MKKKSLFFLLLLPMLLTSAWVRGQNLELRMPDTSFVVGSVVDLPILADSSFTGSDVLSYTLCLNYDPYYHSIESVTSTGTLTESFGLPTVKIEERVVIISGAGSQPLVGSGVFLKIRVRLLHTGWARFTRNGDRMNLWNEGSPTMTQAFGWVEIGSPQTLSVWGDTYLMAKGEKVQFGAWGGVPPYIWSVDDTTMASVDADGILTAREPGRVVVQATDTAGISGWSQPVEIRPVRLSFPDELKAKAGDTIDIPVLVSNLSGLNISSGSFRLRFNGAVLQLVGYSLEGSMLEDYLVNMTQTDTELNLVYAGSQSLTGSGTLVFLRFIVQRTNQWGSGLEFNYATLNEGVLIACRNGNFEMIHPSYRSISADTYSLIVGDSVQFRMYGGTPPIVWSVSDPTRASIDQNGWLKALKNGNVTVMVTDSAGVVSESEPVIIRETDLLMTELKVCNFEEIVRYPIQLRVNPPFEPVVSFEGRIVFDSTYFDLLGTELGEIVPTGWTLTHRVDGTEVQFAASGTQSLSQAGSLLYLLLKPKEAFGRYSWSNLRLESWLFNEGSPGYLWNRYGSIQGREPFKGFVNIWTHEDRPCAQEAVLFESQVGDISPSSYQWLKNGDEISGANQPNLKISGLANSDTIQLKVLYNHPCIMDSVLYSNWIALPVMQMPGKIDSIAGDTVLYKDTKRWWNIEIKDFEEDVEYRWDFPKGFYLSEYFTGSCISVLATDTAQSGWASVFGYNRCGVTDTARFYIRIRPTPIVPDSAGITGPDTLYAGTPDVVYRVWPKLEGATYQWILPDGFTGKSTSDSIHVAVSDTSTSGYLVVYSVFETDTFTLAEKYVDVLHVPDSIGAIWGPEFVCKGEDSLYYQVVNTKLKGPFTWTLPAGFIGISTADTILIGFGPTAKSDTLRVSAKTPVGLTIEIAKLFIDVSSVPEKAGPITGPWLIEMASDSAIYSVPEVPGAHFYWWKTPEGLWGWSETNSITVYAADSTFKGYLCVQAYSWCGPGLSDSILVTVNRGTGWTESRTNGVKYWPNPVQEELLLSLPQGHSDAVIEVRDLTGRLLETSRMDGRATGRLNFRERPSGMYHLTIRWNEGQQSIKVMKK